LRTTEFLPPANRLAYVAFCVLHAYAYSFNLTSANGLSLEICLLWVILVWNMKKLISRIIRVVLIVTIPFLILTLTELLTEITGGEIGNYVQNNYGISTKTLVYCLAFLLFVSLAYEIYDKFSNAEPTSNNLTDNIEPDIKLLFDSLTERYKNRYESKLDGRFEITLEVNKEPFTVNYQTNKNVDEAFKAINESFNQKGRLLIVGSPGSGKTVLLLKLAIELLGDNCKADQKFPVIFNLASWSPVYAKFEDWLIDVLNAGNGLSKDFARTLLEQNRIIFLLDGLDELARNEVVEIAIEKRAKCLDSLNEYLYMGRKAVICCRREEFAAMQTTTNQDAPVSAKVEVLDMTKSEVKDALNYIVNYKIKDESVLNDKEKDEQKKIENSKASATNLLKIIETNNVFLDVLATPFYFTTALEVFDSEILKEKDFPADEESIKKYLLDKFIESKLKHANKLNEFEKDKVIRHWLSWLAKLMEKKQLVNFELAELQPNLLLSKQKYGFIHVYVSSIIVSLALGIASNLFSLFHSIILQDSFYFIFALVTMVVMIIVMFIVSIFSSIFFGLIGMVYYSIRPDSIKTDDNYRFDFKKLFYVKNWGKAFFGGVIGLITCNVSIIPIAILYSLFSATQAVIPYTQLNSPYKRLRGGTTTKIIFVSFAYIIFIVFLLSVIFLLNFSNPRINLTLVNIFFLMFFTTYPIIFLMTPLFRHLILRLCLYLEGSTPIKYATFLDLAADANILEKDGGHWRFRHQTLQEHFAKSGNE
jgi:energy-coupling factor transporter ATP-binding protein EcfA2